MKVGPIERDENDPTRLYIPLPGGWEIQTKGRGSRYRLLDRKTGRRMSILINDGEMGQSFVTLMALDIHAATTERSATDD
jgi:hypothetical protein